MTSLCQNASGSSFHSPIILLQHLVTLCQCSLLITFSTISSVNSWGFPRPKSIRRLKRLNYFFFCVNTTVSTTPSPCSFTSTRIYANFMVGQPFPNDSRLIIFRHPCRQNLKAIHSSMLNFSVMTQTVRVTGFLLADITGTEIYTM